MRVNVVLRESDYVAFSTTTHTLSLSEKQCAILLSLCVVLLTDELFWQTSNWHALSSELTALLETLESV